MSKKYKKAFTLTEVLIVTSMIVIVAGLVLVAMTKTRAKSRDTKRYAEVDTLRMGLEYYYYDNKEYPESPEWIKIEEDEDVGGLFSQAMKDPQYLPQIPRDPLYGKTTEAGDPYSYQYKSTEDKTGYKIHIELEGGGFYEIYSVGGEELVYGGVGPAAPIIVGTTSSRKGLFGTWQRKSFYANGRFWVWYCDGNTFKHSSSPDGLNWDTQSIRSCYLGDGVLNSVFFDGTYVHYSLAYFGFTCDLYYRRGIPESDGTITWSAPEQTVYNGSIFSRQDHPNIAIDSNGYAWIGTKHYSSNDPYVFKNANNDGTWLNDTGFPYRLSTTLSPARSLVVPLTNGRVYVIYAQGGVAPRGQLWNGSGWESEETNLADYAVEDLRDYSIPITATSEGDDIYFAYLRDSTSQIRFNKRVYNIGWQASDELLQNNVETDTFPVISMKTSNNEAYVFWGGSPTADHVYFKKRTSSGIWDNNPTDWIDETTDGLTGDHALTSYFKDYGGRIGFAYMIGSSSPYNIKFESF